MVGSMLARWWAPLAGLSGSPFHQTSAFLASLDRAPYGPKTNLVEEVPANEEQHYQRYNYLQC
jgi:hypothetical protein